jgi:hypothetical protein
MTTNDLIWPLSSIDGEKRRVPLAATPDSGVSPKLAIVQALP